MRLILLRVIELVVVSPRVARHVTVAVHFIIDIGIRYKTRLRISDTKVVLQDAVRFNIRVAHRPFHGVGTNARIADHCYLRDMLRDAEQVVDVPDLRRRIR